MLGSNLEDQFYCQFWLCLWFWILELNANTMKWSNFKACPIVTTNIYGYLLSSFLLSLEDQQFSFFFFFLNWIFNFDRYISFSQSKKNSYSSGNSSFCMDEWKVHLPFKTNWLLQVMLWLYLILGKTFSTLDPRAGMWCPCCRRYIAKKKKCYWNGC